MSREEEELRKRAGRLLESLRRIPPVTADIKAWENDHEDVFSLFRRGCLDGLTEGMLEAPIYHNRQIEDAWLFLFEMRRRHPNRRKQVVECATSLGASYNWSMVLHGSRKIRASLESMLPAVQKEILEAANALELLVALTPNAPAVASNAPPPAEANTPPVLLPPPTDIVSNGHLPDNGSRGDQETRIPAPTAEEERRPTPTADSRRKLEERRPSGIWPASEAQEERTPVSTPTAAGRRTLEERRPSGVWPENEALSHTWPHEAPSSEFNTVPRIQGAESLQALSNTWPHEPPAAEFSTVPRIQGDPFSTNPSAAWPEGNTREALGASVDPGPATPRAQLESGDMPQRSGPGAEPPPGAQRQPSLRKIGPDTCSRNPFDGSGPRSASPGARFLSASFEKFAFSPITRKETRAQTIDPQAFGDEKEQAIHRRYSSGFASGPTSPQDSRQQNSREQWHQGPSWVQSSASAPFSKPPAPNPNNPFMPPRARQDNSIQRRAAQPNGTVVEKSNGYGSSPSSPPKSRTPEQDSSRHEANGAASGDPAAIARSMASRAGAQLSNASRSATTQAQNAMSHARTGSMGTQDKHDEDPPRGLSPAPGQAAAHGQRLGAAVASAASKASASTRNGVAALYSKTGNGSRPGSRASSTEGQAPRDTPAPAVPASWATPPFATPPSQQRRGAPNPWATPPSQQRRGASNGPPLRIAGNERRPDDTGWPS